METCTVCERDDISDNITAASPFIAPFMSVMLQQILNLRNMSGHAGLNTSGLLNIEGCTLCRAQKQGDTDSKQGHVRSNGFLSENHCCYWNDSFKEREQTGSGQDGTGQDVCVAIPLAGILSDALRFSD